jgi:hypothetical protein
MLMKKILILLFRPTVMIVGDHLLSRKQDLIISKAKKEFQAQKLFCLKKKNNHRFL